MILGIVRTKILAILLGTSGVGLTGMYQSVVDLMRSLTGLGLSFSSVKDIAEANKGNDENHIAETVTMLKRWLWMTGLLGTLLTLAFSPLLSRYIFDDNQHVLDICLLSISVLAGTLTAGQLALLQGLRKITWMAKASILGSLFSLLFVLPIYWYYGIRGIVPALLVISFVGLFFSWWYSRKQLILKVSQSWKETWKRGGGMVKLGLYTVASGLIGSMALFLLRSFILKNGGTESVGLFQAVWSISMVYLGAVLTSMAADYYPRLCGIANDSKQMVKFANEQTRFVLLVSTPLILFLLLLSAPVLDILYSNRFGDASTLLRWQLFGTFLKVTVWPIGYILLAKNKGLLFMFVEFVWFFIYLVSTVVAWPAYGIDAAGIGFVIAYVVYVPLVFYLIKPLCSFQFESKNWQLFVGFFSIMSVAFLLSIKIEGVWYYSTVGLLFLIGTLWALFELNKIIPLSDWKNKFKNYFPKTKDDSF